MPVQGAPPGDELNHTLERIMNKAQQIGVGILAAVSLAFAATASASPDEGGRMGHRARGEAHAQGQQHGGMQGMRGQGMQRMAMQGEHGQGTQARRGQHKGGHGASQGAGAGGCAMGPQASAAQGEHQH